MIIFILFPFAYLLNASLKLSVLVATLTSCHHNNISSFLQMLLLQRLP